MENQSVDDILQLRKPVVDYYKQHKQSRNPAEKFAVWMANSVGSVGFFLIIIFWTVIWIMWNTVGPTHLRFDPFPAFEVWVFTANVIQLSLMPLILFGQRLQEKVNEIKSSEEYQLDIRTERELGTMLKLLEKQNILLESINSKLKK